ncbi:MAG: hypothetical protein HY689_10290 [Chloroflexi bacterium]|nr:hypothetical protein [Chloroflexota bacterium]
MAKAKRKLIPVKSLDEIPEHMTDEEAAEFYETHSLGEIWDQLEPVEEEFTFAPLTPMKRVLLRMRQDMLERIEKLAQAKRIPRPALMWLWLHQRLREEEAKQEMRGKPDRPICKNDMLTALEQLPDDATIEDALDCLRFLQKVEYGMAQADAG